MTFDASKFLAKLEGEARRRAEAAAVRAVDLYGEHVLGKAQRLAPIDTGALKNSAVGEPPRQTGHDVEKTIGFNTSYAAAVHERLELHHPQGQAKYLETAIREEAPKFGPFVAAEMKKAL